MKTNHFVFGRGIGCVWHFNGIAAKGRTFIFSYKMKVLPFAAVWLIELV